MSEKVLIERLRFVMDCRNLEGDTDAADVVESAMNTIALLTAELENTRAEAALGMAAARREALEEAAREAEHWQAISTTPGHACGQYIAAAIRAAVEKP